MCSPGWDQLTQTQLRNPCSSSFHGSFTRASGWRSFLCLQLLQFSFFESELGRWVLLLLLMGPSPPEFGLFLCALQQEERPGTSCLSFQNISSARTYLPGSFAGALPATRTVCGTQQALNKLLLPE